MNRHFHSVRLRLTIWYAGVLALALALFALSVYVFVVRTLQTNIDVALQNYAQQMDHVAARHIQRKRLDVKGVPLPQRGRVDTVPAILLMNVQGQTKEVRRGQVTPDYRQLRLSLESGREKCATLQASRVTLRVAPIRFCTTFIYAHGKPVGGVEVAASLALVDRTLDRLRLALLLGIPFVLLLAGSGGWILAGHALEPVDHITHMARSITATDLSRRINLRRQDELGRLAGTFDDMINRLERAFIEQRQLTADVSHELRSPLTILEAQTTLALRRSRSAEEYRQVLTSVQEEVERMSRMVEQLLTLARADVGEEPLRLETISLAALAEPLVDAMQPLAEEEGVRLRFEGDRHVQVKADPARLRQLLLNLLDNALRHTPQGGQIEVSARSLDGQAVLRVSDTGEGIAASDLPHIFQRFYRGDRARQRGTGNSGLGLAIVKWIAEAHGGHVAVVSAPGEGAQFTITFPAAERPAEGAAETVTRVAVGRPELDGVDGFG